MNTPTDPWTWSPSGSRCPGKHTWVIYMSYRFRECCDCGAREDLWADFGIGRRLRKAEQKKPA